MPCVKEEEALWRLPMSMKGALEICGGKASLDEPARRTLMPPSLACTSSHSHGMIGCNVNQSHQNV